jgi:succinate dehydrogenase/fumarate reductase flavoprotein subunit
MEAWNRKTDVLVIGSGAAGMMAARAAADAGAKVVIVDKSLIGRGGATILAQMTVAVALGEAEEDSPDIHFNDTMIGSRGMADADIVRAVVERGPEVVREVETYGVNWARTAEGNRSQVMSPGHSRKRCIYVDILNTGGATSAGLRKAIWKHENIERVKNVVITKLVVEEGVAVGALGFFMEELRPVFISASSIILATGGLTDLYARNSATTNMTGDGYLLASEAGAELRDMEMVQFFPIAHLFPPLVGIDPIMWDPFRYKLGGRLLNGQQEEFMHNYNTEVSGNYTATRDQTTYAIFKEVEAGRGTPHGGAYLDFRQVPESKLKEAFGPVIDLLASQNLDLTRDLVEVAPMAHFMLGGIRVNTQMETSVPGLYACGELIYGMHGANRLSGNAITEALVTGRIAGETAAQSAGKQEVKVFDQKLDKEWGRLQQFWHPREVEKDESSLLVIKRELQRIMWDGAGPLRTETGLRQALEKLKALQDQLGSISLARQTHYVLSLVEKLEVDHMLKLSEAIIIGALSRRESRGAHVRLDFAEQNETVVSTSFIMDSENRWHMQEVIVP